ncbi:uncharacterized protein Z518_10820 [Rhinocladiella mackenziei CBS 650.93]|uniref:Rhinocladiella mackenziei CBS 650.93 unplaced genomic scaffold supercont1.10, whole genome shotgun sequence n=1 Tax=Rhinocladiella mackenziei CBS 650.93 TaxID=1442369 RepID=A0A0D2GND9_9EURO|nr:uncharacterized protein Z518_10820 [Rhinocladiella mackenziei CBS 650.93]KIW99892.1 hypothetical protein Z518_10820 [Rhinocladiella mackenziei CBS 650.93]
MMSIYTGPFSSYQTATVTLSTGPDGDLWILASTPFTTRTTHGSTATPSNLRNATGWQAPPAGRGTFGIVASCLTTLILCIWTVVHLNVPALISDNSNLFARTSRFRASPSWVQAALRPFSHKAKWLLVGLLAPELMVYVAWRQWLLARDFHKKMSDRIKKLDMPFQWTMTHNFFCVMGGFAACYPRGAREDCVTLTTTGILYHFDEGKHEDFHVSETSIRDRSKADYLAKTLVCIQAGWLLIQSAGRLADGLPLTPLEVNTIGHVFCAFFMYYFWLNKPLDVSEPTQIKAEWLANNPVYWIEILRRRRALEDVVSHSLSTTTGSQGALGRKDKPLERSELDLFRSFFKSQEIAARQKPMTMIEKAPLKSELLEYPSNELNIVLTTSKQPNRQEVQGAFGPYLLVGSARLYVGKGPHHVQDLLPEIADKGDQYLTGAVSRKLASSKLRNNPFSAIGIGERTCSTINALLREIHDGRFMLGTPSAPVRLAVLLIDDAGVRRWRHAQESLARTKSGLSLSEPSRDASDRRFEPRALNWPSESLESSRKGRFLLFVGIAFATALYGGLHIAAWKTYMPSSSEHFIWRISALIVAGTGFLMVLVLIIRRVAMSVASFIWRWICTPLIVAIFVTMELLLAWIPKQIWHCISSAVVLVLHLFKCCRPIASDLDPENTEDLSAKPPRTSTRVLNDITPKVTRLLRELGPDERSTAASSKVRQRFEKNFHASTHDRRDSAAHSPTRTGENADAEAPRMSGALVTPFRRDRDEQPESDFSKPIDPWPETYPANACTYPQYATNPENIQVIMLGQSQSESGPAADQNRHLDTVQSGRDRSGDERDLVIDSTHANLTMSEVVGPGSNSRLQYMEEGMYGAPTLDEETPKALPLATDPHVQGGGNKASSSPASRSSKALSDAETFTTAPEAASTKISIHKPLSRRSPSQYSGAPMPSESSEQGRLLRRTDSDFVSAKRRYGRTEIAFGLLLLVPYVLARALIVIEAFISLRKLPVEAYQTPRWSQWLPHFGAG